MSQQENIEQFKSHLSLIKSMTGDKAEEEFYQMMEKAKSTFGDLSLHMGELYFQYAKFLLEKMEKNIDVFNAGKLPEGQQAEEQANPIVEDMLEDDSSLQNQSNRAKSENNVNAGDQEQEHQFQNGSQKNDQPIITEGEADKSQQNKPINNQKLPKQEGEDAEEQNGGDDDFQICGDNLLCAIKIFEIERDRISQGGQEGRYSLSQVNRWIVRCKSRLGDLYHLNENYTEAVNVYREVVQEEEKKLGHESNRGLAEIHYMIANSFLYENKEGCEKIAIQQFIKAVQILINHLGMISSEDTSAYEVPSEQKIKVDRFSYLPKSTDTDETKQIKEVISCLLDKIEDTYEQISIRAQYEAEKKKTKEQEESNKFKQVSPNTTVMKLGTFGNRKKKAQELPDQELNRKSEKKQN